MAPNLLYSFVDVDRSRRARWMLCELDLEFSEERLDWDKGDHQAPGFLGVSPFGLVPGVDLAGVKIFESSAICAYLADLYPHKHLAPPIDSPARAAYTSWIFFGATTLESRVMEVLRWQRDPAAAAQRGEAVADLQAVLARLDSRLAAADYLCGAVFSAADVVAGFPLAVARETGHLDGCPHVSRFVERLALRPGAQKARVFTSKYPS